MIVMFESSRASSVWRVTLLISTSVCDEFRVLQATSFTLVLSKLIVIILLSRAAEVTQVNRSFLNSQIFQGQI